LWACLSGSGEPVVSEPGQGVRGTGGGSVCCSEACSPWFLAALDQTVFATAMPTIVEDLRELTLLPWVTVAYLMAGTVATPVAGNLGDIFGRVRQAQAHPSMATSRIPDTNADPASCSASLALAVSSSSSSITRQPSRWRAR